MIGDPAITGDMPDTDNDKVQNSPKSGTHAETTERVPREPQAVVCLRSADIFIALKLQWNLF